MRVHLVLQHPVFQLLLAALVLHPAGHQAVHVFSQLFGKYGDSGFVEYITETRIAAAKEMLEQGDLKVYEIAEKLGRCV